MGLRYLEASSSLLSDLMIMITVEPDHLNVPLSALDERLEQFSIRAAIVKMIWILV